MVPPEDLSGDGRDADDRAEDAERACTLVPRSHAEHRIADANKSVAKQMPCATTHRLLSANVRDDGWR